MTTLLKGATLVELEPPVVERGDLRIDKGRIVARGTALEPLPNEETTDLSGRVVMPGLVSAHHHLHAGLLRGLSRPPGGFGAEQSVLERLEDALSLDDIQAAAAVGGLEGLCAGTTTVFNLHVSPRVVPGSLAKVAHGLNDTGIRGVLAYEISERAGAVSREEALEEVTGFISRARGRFRGAVGLAHLGATSNDTLTAVKAVSQGASAMLLANVAEDPREETNSAERFGASPLARLLELGLITERTVVSQGVHFSWPDLSELLARGAWMAHAARSNMNTQTGLATPSKFGVRATFGTDVMSLDVLAEGQAASLRARDSGAPIDVLHFLANGHRLASAAFGMTMGPLREDAVADLVVLDYQPPTPLSAETLAAHVLHGMASQHVESVMVDGMWRLWKRKPLSVDAVELARHSREAASAVWSRLAS
ncbi:MAG: amidohydrolase family protein [Myxococcaceae bacterium]|nr:amidohydrolase family protein [Myxococcaceae bacterium]